MYAPILGKWLRSPYVFVADDDDLQSWESSTSESEEEEEEEGGAEEGSARGSDTSSSSSDARVVDLRQCSQAALAAQGRGAERQVSSPSVLEQLQVRFWWWALNITDNTLAAD